MGLGRACRGSEWEWTIESNKNCYVINGQNSSFTPTACGVYNVTLKASNEIGSGSYTRERGIIVCNADSKNGLSFSGRENARVTATTNGFSGQRNVLTVEWWMCPDQLGNNCLGLGESTSTFMINADEKGERGAAVEKQEHPSRCELFFGHRNRKALRGALPTPKPPSP